MKKKTLILIGLKSCGKSTIGPLLSAAMGYDFIDTDHAIEHHYEQTKNEKLSFQEIYQQLGEEEFRKIEHKVIKAQLQKHSKQVISTGGGSLLARKNLALLKSGGILIYLKINQKTLLSRWLIHPPSFVNQNDLKQSAEEYYLQREPLFNSNANIVIDCDEKTNPKYYS